MGFIVHSFLSSVSKTIIKPVLNMQKFNVRLAPYMDETFLKKVADEAAKPQSLRAIARKLDLTVYAVKRLIEYANVVAKN